jgi:hypothetical protein
VEKEHGELYSSYSDVVPEGQFVLGEPFNETKIMQDMHFKNGEIGVIFASNDGSLADRLLALGIIRRENIQGRNVLIIVNPHQGLKFS